MKLDTLIDKTLALIETRGYTKNTWECAFRNGRFSSIRMYFSEHNAEDFDVALTVEYIADLKRRYEDGEYSYSRFAHLRKLALWFIEVYKTGDLPQKILRKSKITVNAYFGDMLNHYIRSMNERVSPSNIVAIKSAVLHLLGFLQSDKNYSDFSKMALKDIQDFIFFISQRRKGRIDQVIYSTRYFLIFLKNNNIIENDLTSALYLKPPIRRKLLKGFEHGEADKILAVPNRDTPVGKRDYAILLTAKTTGLRIGDIRNLELTDIDWRRDEISVIQSKTGQHLVLPLDADTGYAIIDYIRNARPKCNLPYLFLRHNAPHNKLSQQSITTLFTHYREAAGVSHAKGDGKTFHGLRRSLASWMLEADIPLTTIVQVLGHRSLDSAKPYLSVDEKNLKKCSLSLDNIAVSREGLK